MSTRSLLPLLALFAIVFSWMTLRPTAVVAQNLQSLRFILLVFADNIPAQTRQDELAKFGEYLSSTIHEPGRVAVVREPGPVSMLQAFFVGEYYRMQSKLEEAAYWYLQSARSEPTPRNQSGLDYAVRSRLTLEGNLLLHDFETLDGWIIDRVNSNVRDVEINSEGGHTAISFRNQPQQRDTLAYELYFQRLPIGYHSTLSLLAKSNPGTFLTVEVQADGKLTRYLNYQESVGEWIYYDFVIEGSALELVKLSVSEPSDILTASTEYYIELDELKLRLTE
jgi:hypothetical protein